MVRHEKKKLAVAVDLFLHVFNGLDDGLGGGVVMVVTSQLKAGLRPTSYNYIFVLAPNPSVRRRCLQRLLQNSFIHFAECIGTAHPVSTTPRSNFCNDHVPYRTDTSL